MAPLCRRPRLLHLLLVVAVAGFVLRLCVDAAHAGDDAGALLAAKAALTDPAGALSRWRGSASGRLCRWPHVSCAGNSTVAAAEEVAGLYLGDLSLGGRFPDALCSLRSLQELNLSSNLLVGPLPACLAALPALARLDLSSNSFSGEVPAAYGGGFPSLAVLNLVQNFISGAFPGFLANVSALQQLLLAYNSFSPSPLPANLGDLAELRVLFLARCSLNGNIPASIGKLKNLVNLDLSSNNLSGEIPSSIGNLSSLVQMELYANQLSGRIPAGIGGLKKLRFLDMSTNHLSGEIPEDMFTAPSLESVHLFENNLTGRLPATLATAARSLSEVMIFTNQIEGPFPPEFGKNCPLVSLDMSDNRMSGPIPATLCASGKLEQLLLLDNMFDGAIPAELSKCRSLGRVRLANNRLSGSVLPEFWALPGVHMIELSGNALSGNVDAAIGGATNLAYLNITNNRFTGALPTEMGNLTKLQNFFASNNSFSGTIPSSLTNLPELNRLELANNSLSGEIPRDIGDQMTQLDLSYNHFSGTIPLELGELQHLDTLDLSNNELSGEIPEHLQGPHLNNLNLSYNKFTGTVPIVFNTPEYQNSFLGNPGLCYEPCSSDANSSSARHTRILMFMSITTLSVVVILLSILWFTYKYRSYSRRAAEVGSESSSWVITAFYKVEFSERDIVKSISENNVIGEGGSGKVYKAVIGPRGDTFAVKKLWPNGAASKRIDTFESEVATLSQVRHKNIVKLFCCLANEVSRLLVYEFMPNGSLGDFLHSAKATILDWPMRYKIAVGAAEGLCYLHHDCVPAIIHRDVKSNNILLDEDFSAKVADFGVAKTIGDGPATVSVIAGSCGYIAPEYAYTLYVTEKSDVYSFGVVILELVTGKKPISPEIAGKDLVEWVHANIERSGPESVLDQNLGEQFKDEMCKVLDIALICIKNIPSKRPPMRAVVKMLLEVKGENKLKPWKLAETPPAI